MLLALLSTAAALPLLVERFDTLPDGWKERVASQTGGGPPSKMEFVGGAIQLTTDKKTKKFVSLGKRVDLRGITWLTVEAKEKVTGVDKASATSICGAFVRFDTGLVVPTRSCQARDDSEPQKRYIPVPAAARDMEVGVLLDTPGVVTVDDLLVEAGAPPTKGTNRGAVTYHWIGNDSFRDDEFEANEASVAQVESFLSLPATTHLDYWKYPDAATMEAFTGVKADYYASPAVVHSTLRTDTRAVLAALASTWGTPPALFFEGLAVHLAGEWDGREPRLTTRLQVSGGTAVSLSTLLDPAVFASTPPERAYPAAGAFVAWLVETRGAAMVHTLFSATSRTATPAANQAAVEKALGAPLSKVEADFRAWL